MLETPLAGQTISVVFYRAGNESFERSENDSLPAGPPLEPSAAEHLPEAFPPESDEEWESP